MNNLEMVIDLICIISVLLISSSSIVSENVNFFFPFEYQ